MEEVKGTEDDKRFKKMGVVLFSKSVINIKYSRGYKGRE